MAETRANNAEEHNKRVSFGAEEQVRMIVYDDGPSTESYASHHHMTKSTTSFTSNDAPPIKVTATTAESDLPRPISPPAQLEPSLALSPPLPSLLKRMDHEKENPFRPEDILYHEVDPIVEAYRQRPFPPSPTGSPVPPPASSSPKPMGNGANYVHYEDGARRRSGTPTRRPYVTETVDLAASDRRASEKQTAAADQPLLSGGDLPPPAVATEVFIEKKKKRFGCCSVQ